MGAQPPGHSITRWSTPPSQRSTLVLVTGSQRAFPSEVGAQAWPSVLREVSQTMVPSLATTHPASVGPQSLYTAHTEDGVQVRRREPEVSQAAVPTGPQGCPCCAWVAGHAARAAKAMRNQVDRGAIRHCGRAFGPASPIKVGCRVFSMRWMNA